MSKLPFIKRKLANLFFSPLEREMITHTREGYLEEIGWVNSKNRQQPVDQDGNPIPWVTYSFIDFIKTRLSKDITLFEFGSGNSTLFYAKHVGKVTAVEHDQSWYESVRNRMPNNVRLIYELLEYNGAYCRMASAQNELYDAIIVDGRDRVNCTLQSFSCLKPDGILILDDSERTEYLPAIEHLKANGFKHLDLWGISPGLFYRKCTSIFYRTDNCLHI